MASPSESWTNRSFVSFPAPPRKRLIYGDLVAKIRSLKPDPQPARPPKTEVDCLYTNVFDDAGNKLLRLATLGSDLRKLGPKPSQIIEIDEATADALVHILLETFPRISDNPPSH